MATKYKVNVKKTSIDYIDFDNMSNWDEGLLIVHYDDGSYSLNNNHEARHILEGINGYIETKKDDYYDYDFDKYQKTKDNFMYDIKKDEYHIFIMDYSTAYNELGLSNAKLLTMELLEELKETNEEIDCIGVINKKITGLSESQAISGIENDMKNVQNIVNNDSYRLIVEELTYCECCNQVKESTEIIGGEIIEDSSGEIFKQLIELTKEQTDNEEIIALVENLTYDDIHYY